MGEKAITGAVSVVAAIIGVAIIAVLVSPKSQTAGVLTAAGSSLASILKAAVSPVTGNSGGLGNLSLTGATMNGLFGG